MVATTTMIYFNVVARLCALALAYSNVFCVAASS
jgi:hypothetical protein